MRPLDLDELPAHSHWPRRLLDPTVEAVERTREKLQAEFDGDKYKACLDYAVGQAGPVDAQQVRLFEFGRSLDDELCFAHEGQLLLGTLAEFLDLHDGLLARMVGPDLAAAGTVVELGCGYGYNLFKQSRRAPGSRFVGGDFAARAVELAGRLFADDPAVDVVPFDFFAETYDVLAQAAGPVVVYTSYAVCELPDATAFVDAMARHRDDLLAVHHFEPLLEHQGDQTLLGLLGRRYVEHNDYNRNLLTLLEDHPDVEITGLEENVLGVNPLLPGSVLSWRFR